MIIQSSGNIESASGKDFKLEFIQIQSKQAMTRIGIEAMPKSPQISKQHPSTYMTSYWNWMAKFSMVPFKLEWDPDHNQFVARSSVVRQVMCGVITICSILMQLYWVTLHYNVPINGDTRSTSESLLSIFSYIKTLVGLQKGIAFAKLIWRKQVMVLGLANLFQERCIMHSGHYRIYFFLLCLLLVASSVINLVTLDDVKTLDRIPCECSGISSLECILTFVKLHWMAILAWVEITVITSTNFLFYSFVLSMGWAGARYEEECFPKVMAGAWWDERKMFEKRISMYYTVKGLARQSSQLMGSFIFALYLELLLYFANSLGGYAELKKDRLQFMLFILNTGLTMIFWTRACEFHQKVNGTTSDWIQLYNENSNSQITLEERGRLISLSSEVAISPIGISCRFFCVTYGFMGSMLGLIITYGILVLQMSPQN